MQKLTDDVVIHDLIALSVLKKMICQYVFRVKTYSHKTMSIKCKSDDSEFHDQMISFFCSITVCMNFIIDLICSDVSDFFTSDCRQFVDTSIEENSSFFLQWERDEDAWKRDYLNCEIQKVLLSYLWLRCDCFLFLYFRISVLIFADEINMIFLILVNFFKSFCFSDW